MMFLLKKTEKFKKTPLEIYTPISTVVGDADSGNACGATSISGAVCIDHTVKCEDKNQCFALKDRSSVAYRGVGDHC